MFHFQGALLLTLALCALGLRASQGGAPPSEREQIAAALKVLNARGATPLEQDTAMVELMFLGVEGPKTLASWLGRELEERCKASAKEETRLLHEFEQHAGRLVVARRERSAEIEIDKLRAVVRRNAQSSKLTQEIIQAESDPAVTRLTELLSVEPGAVWQAQPELHAAWEALLGARDREFDLFGMWESNLAALISVPGGGAGLAERYETPVPPALDAAALLDELERRAELATPMSQTDRRALDHNAALPVAADGVPREGELGAQEKLGVRFLNRRRVLLGLPAQVIDLKLCNACRGHSQDMAEHDFFSHDSPLEGKKTPWDRAGAAGTSASAENIARGSDTGQGAILQWWYSPGHHRNMLGGGARTGLGQFEQHWTQLFGG